jgi:hypothetical protein
VVGAPVGSGGTISIVSVLRVADASSSQRENVSAAMDPNDADVEPRWLDADSESALRAVVPHVMDAVSVALYARWWQLETWLLRELIYVELRAQLGTHWTDVVKAASGRQAQDAAFTHMSGPDNDNPLAYLDYAQLLNLIDSHWDQIGYALLEQRAWQGRQDELKRIRHRIGHLRKPHPDDLNRLEQTLRDLERGTFIALASYNDRDVPDTAKHHDAVTSGWLGCSHPDARRLINHADRQYDTRLLLRISRRPTTRSPNDLAGAAGVFWHADFITRDRAVDVADLWHDSALDGLRPLLVHLLADDPGHVGFTFAAVDDSADIADAIGGAFDAVLLNARLTDCGDLDYVRWRRRARGLDYRVLSQTGWNIVDDSTLPISNFGAGGVSAKPNW